MLLVRLSQSAARLHPPPPATRLPLLDASSLPLPPLVAQVSRVAGTNVADPSRTLTSGILLQGVPKCLKDKCLVQDEPPEAPLASLQRGGGGDRLLGDVLRRLQEGEGEEEDQHEAAAAAAPESVAAAVVAVADEREHVQSGPEDRRVGSQSPSRTGVARVGEAVRVGGSGRSDGGAGLMTSDAAAAAALAVAAGDGDGAEAAAAGIADVDVGGGLGRTTSVNSNLLLLISSSSSGGGGNSSSSDASGGGSSSSSRGSSAVRSVPHRRTAATNLNPAVDAAAAALAADSAAAAAVAAAAKTPRVAFCDGTMDPVRVAGGCVGLDQASFAERSQQSPAAVRAVPHTPDTPLNPH